MSNYLFLLLYGGNKKAILIFSKILPNASVQLQKFDMQCIYPIDDDDLFDEFFLHGMLNHLYIALHFFLILDSVLTFSLLDRNINIFYLPFLYMLSGEI